ncbi:hypothetical protein SAY87_015275 [Trapa incisa]|uniref:Transmembrane protein n=1 Tax=Trapa incisa TaxID=236973 RepID=A0AAN7JKW3_9MYRT|nr:hypothetical protein SAY87_015275 [Trapa incisa]
MAPSPSMKPSFFLVFIFLLIISPHPLEGYGGGFRDPNSVAFARSQVQLFPWRKLIRTNGQLLDYEPPGSNPAHDPPTSVRRGGKGGGP